MTKTLEATLHSRARTAAQSSTTTSTRKTTTATKRRTRRGKRAEISAIAAAELVLRRSSKPLHVNEITKRILAMPETGLKGKTPAASVGAILAVNAKKPGTVFRRTAPSTYTVKKARKS